MAAIKGARNLLAKFGAQVEPALYALLCDQKSTIRETVDKALKGGTASASAILVPLLIGEFALAPAVATVVAAVAMQAIAAAGQEKLCQELAKAQAGWPEVVLKSPPKAKLARPKTASKTKATPSKRTTKKK